MLVFQGYLRCVMLAVKTGFEMDGLRHRLDCHVEPRVVQLYTISRPPLIETGSVFCQWWSKKTSLTIATVKPVWKCPSWRDHLSEKTTVFWLPEFPLTLESVLIEPLLKDHFSLTSRVVFSDRFYNISLTMLDN